MTAELTSEQIVTRILTSNEIIKPKKENLYISNPKIDTLGDFLPEFSDSPEPFEIKSPEDLRYRFIKR